jgi:hypothetical protein
MAILGVNRDFRVIENQIGRHHKKEKKKDDLASRSSPCVGRTAKAGRRGDHRLPQPMARRANCRKQFVIYPVPSDGHLPAQV